MEKRVNSRGQSKRRSKLNPKLTDGFSDEFARITVKIVDPELSFHIWREAGIAAVAFGIGAGSSTFWGRQAWQWDSSLSIMCITLAVLCATLAAAAFVSFHIRDKEAADLRADIRSSIDYAKGLQARAQQAQAASDREPL